MLVLAPLAELQKNMDKARFVPTAPPPPPAAPAALPPLTSLASVPPPAPHPTALVAPPILTLGTAPAPPAPNAPAPVTGFPSQPGNVAAIPAPLSVTPPELFPLRPSTPSAPAPPEAPDNMSILSSIITHNSAAIKGAFFPVQSIAVNVVKGRNLGEIINDAKGNAVAASKAAAVVGAAYVAPGALSSAATAAGSFSIPTSAGFLKTFTSSDIVKGAHDLLAEVSSPLTGAKSTLAATAAPAPATSKPRTIVIAGVLVFALLLFLVVTRHK